MPQRGTRAYLPEPVHGRRTVVLAERFRWCGITSVVPRRRCFACTLFFLSFYEHYARTAAETRTPTPTQLHPHPPTHPYTMVTLCSNHTLSTHTHHRAIVDSPQFQGVREPQLNQLLRARGRDRPSHSEALREQTEPRIQVPTCCHCAGVLCSNRLEVMSNLCSLLKPF